VTAYTLLLAESLQFPPDEIVCAVKGALVHDVGKLAIPDSILHKPGGLTPEERAEMNRHVRYGVEIISQSRALLEASPIVAAHHERYDGQGYVCQLSEAIGGLSEAPVLIGHSMGSLVCQRYLEKGGAARAVAFMSPIPPSGTGLAASRILLRQPNFFQELDNAVQGCANENTLSVISQMYFSPSMALEKTAGLLHLIQPESSKAVLEMLLFPMRLAGRVPDIPALVVGGGRDQVFPSSLLHFTSAIWRARTVIVEEAGHMLMLDPQWQEAAAVLDDWITASA